MPKRSKKYLLLFFLAAVILLAGVFYWSFKNSQDKLKNPTTQNQPIQNSFGLPNIENEIVTSSPLFKIEGEISRGNSNKKQIIFTFDAGAGTHSAQKILEITKDHGIETTFFITGKFAEKNPELIRQIAAQGHEIFNHTYSHPHLTQLTDEEIKEEFKKTEDIISSLTDISTRPYFRPPYGDRNAHVLDVAAKEGYQSVFWTLDALDWMTGKTAQEVKGRVFANLKPGAIILMHVGDEITGNILDEVFTKIGNDGYRIVSLSESLK